MAGCGATLGNNSTGSGSGPVIGGSPSNASPGCGGTESGYNNQNGLGIWLQSPAPGANPSNVTVNATAYDSATIQQWTVCLDGQAVYQTNTAETSISRSITIPNGQHLLWASATDSNSNYNRSEIRLIQVATPPPSAPTMPTPPSNATVLSEMQNDQANWSICSQCAAGTNVTKNYTLTFDQSQPSLSGSSLEMYAGGPRWSNVLFKDIMMGTNHNTHFLWDFWVYHDPAVENHFWSSELDFYVVLSGNEYMIGSQCDFGDGYWSTWDSNGNRWVLNGIPCPHWTPGWHHVQEYDELVNNGTQYRYDTIVFDGTPYALNQTWNTNSTTWQDQTGLQFQLDQDPTGTPLHEWADKVTLTEW
ncbi:MAG: hypothetical protein ACLGSD_06695 [Acidobacteriota bacterium]